MNTLHLSAACGERIRRFTRRRLPDEAFGLLASAADDDAVTVATLFTADSASSAHCEVAATELRKGVRDLLARHLKPRGVWHSHADAAPFISSTDEQMAGVFFPALAELAFTRVAPDGGVPHVRGPAVAVLPVQGRRREFELLGRPIPGTDLREPVSWGRVTTRFTDPALPPAATLADVLVLRAGGVRLRLELPPGATVSSREVDDAPRVSDLFSLVTNSRGEMHCEAYRVWDLAGHVVIDHRPCPVSVADAPRAAERNGRLTEVA